MKQSLSFLGVSAILALAGCSHQNRDVTVPPTGAASDTMQSQINEATVPYRFPLTDGTPRPDARSYDARSDTRNDFSDLIRVDQRAYLLRDRSGFPAPNSSNPPLPHDEVPAAP